MFLLHKRFVAHFHLSVGGVAFATIISWSIAATLAVRALMKNTGAVKLKLNRIRVYTPEITNILKIGVPAGMQQALYSIANVIITATVNSFGAEATVFVNFKFAPIFNGPPLCTK